MNTGGYFHTGRVCQSALRAEEARRQQNKAAANLVLLTGFKTEVCEAAVAIAGSPEGALAILVQSKQIFQLA